MLATFMRRIRNNNLEIGIAGSCSRPLLKDNITSHENIPGNCSNTTYQPQTLISPRKLTPQCALITCLFAFYFSLLTDPDEQLNPKKKIFETLKVIEVFVSGIISLAFSISYLSLAFNNLLNF